jgi:hypothetical protein
MAFGNETKTCPREGSGRLWGLLGAHIEGVSLLDLSLRSGAVRYWMW